MCTVVHAADFPAKPETGTQPAGKSDPASFFRPSLAQSIHLNPAGTHVALLSPDAATGTNGITIIDLARQAATGLRASKDYNIHWARWVGDDILIFATTSHRWLGALSTGRPTANRGIYAIQRQNPTDVATLVEAQLGSVVAVHHEGHRFTLAFPAAEYVDNYTLSGLVEFELTAKGRVKVLKTTPLPSPPGSVRQWFVDRDNVPRCAWTTTPSGLALYRSTGAGWKRVESVPSNFNPSALGEDPDTVFGYLRQKEGRGAAPVRMNLADGKTTPASARDLVRAEAEARRFDLTDPLSLTSSVADAELLSAIRGALPANAVNAVVDRSANRQRLLIYSRQPLGSSSLHLFDQTARTLQRIADLTPWLNTALEGPSRRTTFGVKSNPPLLATITTPDHAATKPPLIVFLPDQNRLPSSSASGTRLFASSGYVVMQPYPLRLTNRDPDSPPKSADFLLLRDNVLRLVREFTATGAIDPGRIFLVGEGSQGWLAANCASGAPDLFRGVVLLQNDTPRAIRSLWDSERDFAEEMAVIERELPLPDSSSLPLPLFVARTKPTSFDRPAMLKWEDTLARTPAATHEFLTVPRDIPDRAPTSWRDRATLYLRAEAFLKKHL